MPCSISSSYMHLYRGNLRFEARHGKSGLLGAKLFSPVCVRRSAWTGWSQIYRGINRVQRCLNPKIWGHIFENGGICGLSQPCHCLSICCVPKHRTVPCLWCSHRTVTIIRTSTSGLRTAKMKRNLCWKESETSPVKRWKRGIWRLHQPSVLLVRRALSRTRKMTKHLPAELH